MEFEQRLFIEKVCNAFNTPAAILDGNLTCLYCNREGFFEKGRQLASCMLTEIKRPITKESKAMVSMNGIKYSVRVFPFLDEFYFCEFFDVQEVYSIAEFTDFYDHIMPYSQSMNKNIADLWMGSNVLEKALRERKEFELSDKLYELKRSLNALNSDNYNISGIVELMFKKQDPTPIQIHFLIKDIIIRCNTLLKKCGRAIEYESDAEEYYILSDKRYAMTALINALQNALLYSPGNTIPLVLLSSVLEKDTRYVVMKVVNDSIYFVDEKNRDNFERNFNFQRVGLGIPIIKRFAKKCDGTFSMEEMNGKVIIELKIPQYIPEEPTELILESPGRNHYKTGVPDLIDVKMNDVINFFGEIEV